jgi:hypothetical protein
MGDRRDGRNNFCMQLPISRDWSIYMTRGLLNCFFPAGTAISLLTLWA